MDHKSALDQIMAWRRRGDKSLSEPMMAYFTDAYMRHSIGFNPPRLIAGSFHYVACPVSCPYHAYMYAWWRHRMETFSSLLALCAGNSPVTGEFPSQRPVVRSFDDFFDIRLNKRLSKKSMHRWFETPSCSLWRHCNGTYTLNWREIIKFHHMWNKISWALCSRPWNYEKVIIY